MIKRILKPAVSITVGVLLSINLLLEILPVGIKMQTCLCSSSDPYLWYSYFSIVPYGYGIFPPLIIAVLSSISVVLFILDFFFKMSKFKYAIMAIQVLVIGFGVTQLCISPLVTVINIIIPILSLLVIGVYVASLIYEKVNTQKLSA